MRRNSLIQEELRQAILPFRHLIEQNEWLNFSEMVQRIRISESLSNSSARASIMILSGTDGIVRNINGEITVHLVYGGYVLDCAS